jgi:hypothetical protein
MTSREFELGWGALSVELRSVRRCSSTDSKEMKNKNRADIILLPCLTHLFHHFFEEGANGGAQWYTSKNEF